MTFDPTALQQARERNGGGAEDRPSEVDETLAPREIVGFQTEASLLDCGYDEYPDGEELYRPAMGDTLQTLAEHDKVGSAEDISDELGTDVETVEKACDLHGIDVVDGSGYDIEVTPPRLHALLGADYPEAMIDPHNQITVGTLYVEKGLSVAEIAKVLSEVRDHSVPERVVRQTLVDARLLEGRTTEEQEHRRKQNRDSGLTIHTGDY